MIGLNKTITKVNGVNCIQQTGYVYVYIMYVRTYVCIVCTLYMEFRDGCTFRKKSNNQNREENFIV